MWTKLNINSNIVEALKACDLTTPTQIQQKCIKPILLNKDLVGASATGSGKTLAFALPIIQNINEDEKGVEALVLCPTRELAMQVCEEFKKVLNKMKSNIKVVPIYGGADFSRQVTQLVKGAKIVVGTPGRTLDHLTRKSLRLKSCKTLVLDEADEMLDMGFRPDIEKVLAYFKQKPQILLFSATMPKPIMELIDKYLQDPENVTISTANKPNENITQEYVVCEKSNKMQNFLSYVKGIKTERAIVFCNTKAMTDKVSMQLTANGYKADKLNGDMAQNIRKKVLDNFKKSQIQFLVCTDVASRGLDIGDLSYVINFDFPKLTEWYIHRIGRTGRMNKKGFAVTLLNTSEQIAKLKELTKQLNCQINELKVSVKGVEVKQTQGATARVQLKEKAKQNDKVKNKGKAKSFDNNNAKFPKQENKKKFGKEAENKRMKTKSKVQEKNKFSKEKTFTTKTKVNQEKIKMNAQNIEKSNFYADDDYEKSVLNDLFN